MKIPTEFERAGLKQAARLTRAFPSATRRALGDAQQATPSASSSGPTASGVSI